MPADFRFAASNGVCVDCIIAGKAWLAPVPGSAADADCTVRHDNCYPCGIAGDSRRQV